MAIQDDKTILNKGDLKAYHEAIAPMLGGTFMVRTNTSDYYSTDEKVVGVWTDGRPIYQKTYFTGALPNNSSKEVSTGVSNIDDVTSITGYAIENSEYWYPITYANTSAYVIKTYYRKSINSIVINTYADWGSNTDSCVTLQYTKTTDTAGSATTTPGAYDINFPNTWPTDTEIYFGNGVYGKRFTGSVTASSTWQDVLKQLDSVDRGTSFQFIATGGSIRRRGGDTCMSLGHQDTLEYELWYASSVSGQPSGIRLRGKDNSNTPVDYDLWCTYTK